MKDRLKKNLLVAGVCTAVLALVLVAALVFYCPKYISDATFCSSLGMYAYEHGAVSVAPNGKQYYLSPFGTLFCMQESQKEIITFSVDAMQPVSTGVAYQKSSRLFIWENGETKLLSDNITTFCCNAESVFYCENSTIMQYKDEKITVLLNDTFASGDLISNNKWLVFYSEYKEGIEDKSQVSCCISLLSGKVSDIILIQNQNKKRYALLLYEDTLLHIGADVAIDLNTRQSRELSVGMITQETQSNVSATVNGSKLYLSLKCDTFFGWKDTKTITAALDTATWEAETIDGKYYGSLLCTTDGEIYGLKKNGLFFSHCGNINGASLPENNNGKSR